MVSPTTGARRLLRAAALGSASLALAAGGHWVGHGQLPATGALALISVPVGLLAVALTARRLRLPLLTGALSVEQLALHQLFMRLGSGGGCVTSGSLAHLGHHAGAASAPGAAALSCRGTAMPGMESMAAGGTAMLAGHVVATVVTAWLLWRGEALLWRAARRLVRPVRLPSPRVVTANDVRVVAGRLAALTARTDLLTAAPRAPPRPSVAPTA